MWTEWNAHAPWVLDVEENAKVRVEKLCLIKKKISFKTWLSLFNKARGLENGVIQESWHPFLV